MSGRSVGGAPGAVARLRLLYGAELYYTYIFEQKALDEKIGRAHV